jgi:hypothetical protein
MRLTLSARQLEGAHARCFSFPSHTTAQPPPLLWVFAGSFHQDPPGVPVPCLERRTKPDRAGQGDASAPRREDEGVRMHVESEQRRRATRIRRPATGGFVRRSNTTAADTALADFQLGSSVRQPEDFAQRTRSTQRRRCRATTLDRRSSPRKKKTSSKQASAGTPSLRSLRALRAISEVRLPGRSRPQQVLL